MGCWYKLIGLAILVIAIFLEMICHVIVNTIFLEKLCLVSEYNYFEMVCLLGNAIFLEMICHAIIFLDTQKHMHNYENNHDVHHTSDGDAFTIRIKIK